MPDASAATKAGGGWLLEVPIRAPGLPVNLWVHWSGLAVNWPPRFFGYPQEGDWHRERATVSTQVAEGDVALAGQATLGLSAVRRDTQGLLDTDDWGVSCIDWLDPLPAPVVGPNYAVFSGQMAHRGRAWPGGISLTIDLLVVRKSLIPAVPPVHGATPPAHQQLGASTVKKADAVNDTRAALRRQLTELLATLETVTAREFAEPDPARAATPDAAPDARDRGDRSETEARRTPGKAPTSPRRRRPTNTDA